MRIPLIEDLTKGSVPAGSNILVEFDADSQWYNASVTMAAGWLKTGGNVAYVVHTQPPGNIRSKLRQFGLEAEELERIGRLRIVDVYTATLGQKSTEKIAAPSLKVADLSIFFGKRLKEDPFGPDWLRMIDNRSVLARFNDEKALVELVLSRVVPRGPTDASTIVDGFVRNFHSDWLYKALEAAYDGIIDFRLEEQGGIARDVMRIRTMRTVHFDRDWHQLRLGENFEVTLEK